jgi:hypothetical protein
LVPRFAAGIFVDYTGVGGHRRDWKNFVATAAGKLPMKSAVLIATRPERETLFTGQQQKQNIESTGKTQTSSAAIPSEGPINCVGLDHKSASA